MSESTIKTKEGICRECTDGKIKKLSTGLCGNHKRRERAAIYTERAKGRVAETRGKASTGRKADLSNENNSKTRYSRELALYHKELPAWKEANPICMLKFDDCENFTVDAHHPKGRGKHLRDWEIMIATCRNCHDLGHALPKDKQVEIGFSFYRNRINTTTP